MVGGGARRDEGSFTINNSNVFSALDSLRKKKKSDKEKKISRSSAKTPAKEVEPQIIWAPTPLTSKSWADVDDEDDDDYYATTAPPQSVWAASQSHQPSESLPAVEESESEDDMLDLGDEEVEEDHASENDAGGHFEPVAKKATETAMPPKETERQLSKKERKKKELEELEALLADFGVSQKDTNGQGNEGLGKREKGETSENGEKEGPIESKTSKKKKKKEKSCSKDAQNQPNTLLINGEVSQQAGADRTDEDSSSSSTVDVKERLKKVVPSKKKKSGKELDGAAKAAAMEAAARSKKLAAAKKKEKNHYNQQPVR